MSKLINLASLIASASLASRKADDAARFGREYVVRLFLNGIEGLAFSASLNAKGKVEVSGAALDAHEALCADVRAELYGTLSDRQYIQLLGMDRDGEKMPNDRLYANDVERNNAADAGVMPTALSLVWNAKRVAASRASDAKTIWTATFFSKEFAAEVKKFAVHKPKGANESERQYTARRMEENMLDATVLLANAKKILADAAKKPATDGATDGDGAENDGETGGMTVEQFAAQVATYLKHFENNGQLAEALAAGAVVFRDAASRATGKVAKVA